MHYKHGQAILADNGGVYGTEANGNSQAIMLFVKDSV
jgi:hypothetical protein